MEIGKKIDRAESIAWGGAIFTGIVIIVFGLIWLLANQEIIKIDIWSVCSIFVILVGIGVIVFGLWLRSVIKYD